MTDSSRYDGGMNFLIPTARNRSGDDPIFALNAEAKARAEAGADILNATVGALTGDDGRLALLPTVTEILRTIPARVAAGYAPIQGHRGFLEGVITDLFDDTHQETTVAVATPGGSGALHLAITSFLEPGQAVLVPDYYWGPYRTMAHHSGREVQTFQTFDDSTRFCMEALDKGLDRSIAAQGRALAILNFPCNNPTGYSLDRDEWKQVAEILGRAGRRAPVALVIDHAYARFGGADGDGWREVCDTLSESVQLLLAWSGSKAFAQYGARVGALVAVQNDAAEREEIHNALGFACRGIWSNCNHAGQAAIGRILTDPDLKARADRERGGLHRLLGERVDAFNREATGAGLRYPRYEGGFFVSVFCEDGKATAGRMRDDGVYVIPMNGAVRVALCSTPAAAIPRLVESLRE